MDPILTCFNIQKSFGKNQLEQKVLKNVSFEAFPNELLMLVGPSGSGKTTLLSIISGILSPDKGSCNIFNTNIHELPDSQKTVFRGKNIGFVFQAFNLLPMLTVENNIAMPLLINNAEPKKSFSSVQAMLNRFNLSSKKDKLPSELSGGEQQRVAIARAIIHQPSILICDEPTSALDQENGSNVLERLKEIAYERNRLVIVVTHDQRIFNFADRILALDNGRLNKFHPL